MKKENIVLILFPLVWAFYFFFMKGHIGYWEETNFFQWNSVYWNDFLLKPGGWSEYIGNFLLQFYRWTGLGALLQTLFSLGIFLLLQNSMRKLMGGKISLIVTFIPVILVCYLQLHSQILIGEILKIFFFFLLFWIYLKISKKQWRVLIFTVILPIAYLLLSTGGWALLYITFALYEVQERKENIKWVIALSWLLLVACYPYIWKRWMFFVPENSLYTFSGVEEVNHGQLVEWIIYLYGIFLAFLSRWIVRIHNQVRPIFSTLELIGVVMVYVIVIYVSYPGEKEHFYRIDQAANQGEWDEVLQMAGRGEKLDRNEMYLLCLALANKGELGERLFEYPVWGIGCLYLPRQLDYTTNVLGGEFYYRLKIPNEAIHWTFQASVASRLGMDFRTLKRLIELNIQKGDIILADKYLTILEESLCYKDWCKEKRKKLLQGSGWEMQPDIKRDFFIGGRPFLSDMARVLDAGRSEDMTLDYILCGLLLNKDLGKFCTLFTGFFPVETKRIPKAYQEALLVARTMKNSGIADKNYSFDPEIVKKFEDYNAIFRTYGKNKELGKEMMKNFQHTVWYYFHFIEPRPMDEQGHMLDNNRGYSS